MVWKVKDLAFKSTNFVHICAEKVNVIQFFVLVREKLHPLTFRGFTFNSAASLIRVTDIKSKNLRTKKVFR